MDRGEKFSFQIVCHPSGKRGTYMTTTMLVMKDVIEGLKKEKVRDKVKVLVGGVPLTQEYADEIGADAWGKDALDAVEKAKKLKGVS